MRTLQIGLQLLGLLLLAFFTLNMFFFWVMDDILWLLSLFFGIMVFMMGCLVETWRMNPVSDEMIRRKKVKEASCLSAIGLCGIMIMFIISSLI